MGNTKNDGKIGVSLGAELLARCDAAIEKANARNRSDFIRDAVEHYLAVLNAQENSKVLTPALESVINSRIAMTEHRISQMLYKLAVEIAMTNYIHTEDVYSDVRYLNQIREICTRDVKALNGSLNLEEFAQRYGRT